jgi:hypothetical protein
LLIIISALWSGCLLRLIRFLLFHILLSRFDVFERGARGVGTLFFFFFVCVFLLRFFERGIELDILLLITVFLSCLVVWFDGVELRCKHSFECCLHWRSFGMHFAVVGGRG